ncbi:MBOAT family O-acyltransferase [Lewinella cohaerens]|uniref:MBOAT family O-acyltransferase n=1 Tax=Lewinella cohaerens TaxID=70995 RepID=UPI00035CA8FC|nr:MBOAT family O-acyltransferase [Lewinella cohaerens]
MLFQSFDFLVLFPIVVGIYFLLPKDRRWIWVLLSSYGFYLFWNPWYIVLLWVSTLTDYLVSHKIHQTVDLFRRKIWLGVSIAINLGLLITFKYYNFFAEQFAWVMRWQHPDFDPYLLDFLLPIGISFYTFQTLGYTIDVYRKHTKPVRHLGKFAIYVAFFPQLVAGPIERAVDLLPQLHFDYSFDIQRITEGLRLFLWGLFKKLVVADRIGLFVAAVFSTPGEYQGWVVLIGGYLFFFQIYYDFTAYQDMAVGTARILGIKLSKNFDPLILLSSSFRRFWQGWHITLTTWIRDYVYRPLALNEKQLANLAIGPFYIFFLVGLWHGANWTYIIWGSLHGLYMIAERQLGGISIKIGQHFGQIFQKALGFILFFNAFTLANIFFRSSSVQDAWVLLGEIFKTSSPSLNPGLKALDFQLLWIVLVCSVLFEYARRRVEPLELLNLKSSVGRWAIYLLMGLAIWFLRIPEDVKFIYFEF